MQVDDVRHGMAKHRQQDGERDRPEACGQRRRDSATPGYAVILPRSPAPRGMIVEISANAATGSSA